MDRPGFDSAEMFIGQEVEQTMMWGQPTLFVIGLQEAEKIKTMAAENNIQHIYFGANHSYNPVSANEYYQWDDMIKDCLDADFWCTLDMDIRHVENFLDSGLTEHNKFIPMLSCKIPYINQLGYNAILKIDDKDFAASNPGVWCHRLHDLQSYNSFTHWDEYKDDKITVE